MEDSNQDMPKIIKFLQDDGYEFQNIDYNPQYGGSARAIFEKMTHIDEINGNDVNDATITVTVDFDRRFDYKNGVEDEEEGIIYDFDLDFPIGKVYIINGIPNKLDKETYIIDQIVNISEVNTL